MIAGTASHQIIVPAWNPIGISSVGLSSPVGCPLIVSSVELIAHKDSARLLRPISYPCRYIFQE